MNPGVFASPYPVALDLADKAVLIVGAGQVGERKARGVLKAGARVTVVSPTAVPEVVNHRSLRWHQRPYQRGEVASYRLAIAATNDPNVNAQVAADADAANVFVNSVDDPANCTFTLPAILREGDISVAVSTNGRSPALARWLRHRILPKVSGAGELLDVVSEVREEARVRFGTSELSAWDTALNDDLFKLVRAGRAELARSQLWAALDSSERVTPSVTP